MCLLRLINDTLSESGKEMKFYLNIVQQTVKKTRKIEIKTLGAYLFA